MVTAAERISAAKARRISQVEVNGEQWHVRKLGADVVMDMLQRIRDGNKPKVCEWLAFGVCNEDGSDYFTEEEAVEYATAAGLEAVMLADAVADKSGLGAGTAAKN
jgi:hypothetical protein